MSRTSKKPKKKPAPQRFAGVGPGKPGGWTRITYHPDGRVEYGAPRSETSSSAPAVHVNFRPFVSHQVDRATARKLGLKRTRNKGTAFSCERELKRYVDHENHHGREVGWKDA